MTNKFSIADKCEFRLWDEHMSIICVIIVRAKHEHINVTAITFDKLIEQSTVSHGVGCPILTTGQNSCFGIFLTTTSDEYLHNLNSVKPT